MRRFLVLMVLFLNACMPAASLPSVTAEMGAEFALSSGQSATIANTGLTLTLVSVQSDRRCPLEIECAESGPVTVVVAVQSGSDAPTEITFQTFTDNDGRVPEIEFEGMKDQVKFEDYQIQVESILPFPRQSVLEIKASDYKVSFTVTK